MALELPTPRLFPIEDSRTGRTKEMIGIRTSTISGEPKIFIWWANFTGRNIDDPKDRRKIVSDIVRFKLGLDIDTAVGPAVDPFRTTQRHGIKIVDRWIGLYIDADKRLQFSAHRQRVPLMRELLLFHPQAEELFQQVLQNLIQAK